MTMNRYLIANANRLLLFCAGVALVAMMLTVCLNVATKYMFDFPIAGTLEITAYYYMPIAVCLALAPVQFNSAHISVELITRSEERRVGKEGVSTCRSRLSPYP